MQSVVSYPERGEFGNNLWRGNTSGKLLVDLLEFTSNVRRRPIRELLFAEQFEGGGTGRDVAKALGCEFVGLDLYRGNDITTQSILSQLPRPADLTFGHPPYAGMLPYSGSQWGDKPVDGDLSLSSMSKNEFHERMQIGLLNMREATEVGGIYAILIGDMRKNGQFWSFQSDLIQRSAKDELVSVTIKEQHNCMSDAQRYSGASFIPIKHEYCLIFKRKSASMYQVCYKIASDLKTTLDGTWRSLVRLVMMMLGEAPLQSIYDEVEKVAGVRIANNPHWKAKVRQTLQRHCTSVSRGVWAA